MRLAKLTVSGFKSFADTTEFTFDHPVTGIVGPNGCGKSNIVDAIKWVLGERSSKSLRGTEMIDVIFAGSAGRKPGGMASVTLSFENPERAEPLSEVSLTGVEKSSAVHEGSHAENGEEEPSLVDRAVRSRRVLPIDADLVEVERRLYRDGESAYLINGRKARLKDIRELFLDTGVGADAYSIIEQGKVDAMLLASPQERRTIFEEASGIAKYKQRRIEAQRKLDRAQTNLTGVREQLDSTERRLRLVRGQAAKARKFKELDGELKAWRLALAFEQYDDLEQRIVGLVSRHSDLGARREAGAASLADLETDRQEAEAARHQAESRHQALEQERLGAVHAEQQATQRRTMLERAVADAQRQSSADQDRLAGIAQRRADCEATVERTREAAADLAERVAEGERALTSAGERRAAALEELNERRNAASQKQSAVARMDRERAALLASIGGDAKRAESVREQIERLSAKAAKLFEDERAVREQAAGSEASLRAAQARLAEYETALAELEQSVGRLSADRRELAERVTKLDQELVRTESRRATLQEMVQTRAGFAEAVREVLTLRDAGNGFTGVIAPLADLVETRADVDAESAAAVESALGMDLQGLVIASAEMLPGAAEMARVRGRVTFLPKAGVHASAAGHMPSIDDAGLLGVPVDDPSGRLVSLRSLVQPREGHADDAELHDLLDRLVGRTYLVASVEAALLLSAGPMRGLGARFITRDGKMIDPQGRVTAGSGSGDEAAGILRRRRELEELEDRVTALSASLSAEQENLRAVDARAGETSSLASRTRSDLAQQQRALLNEQNRLDRFVADAARIERERGGLVQETDQLRGRLARIEEDSACLRDRADSLGRLQEEESSAVAELEAGARESQQRADAAMEQLSTAKVTVGTLSEQLASTRRELNSAEVMRDDLSRQARDVEAQAQRLEARLAEHASAIAECVEQIAAAQTEGIRLRAESEAARAEVEAAEAAARSLGERLAAMRAEFAAVEREWHSLEVAKRELEVKRETAEERASDDLGIDIRAEHAEYREMMAGGDVARIDTAEAALRIDTLREAVRRLGGVNLESIEEESNLEQMNEDLVKQVADIDAACTQLAELIAKLNDASRRLFGETFAKIQDNFGGDHGMFRKLFNGGKAEVRLMSLVKEVEEPDGTIRKVETGETDLLESGIEVIAKPPGKEPRSISQLSGGEKTLTAVALLMSIFRSRPSCFCVLDEVDAALDEGNVGRFNSVVREYTDRSSFIVITHNKRTMQSADRLYGITQQERGVSTRVAVRFDDVGKNGEIRSGAQPVPPPEVPVVVVAQPVMTPAGANPAMAPASKRTRRPTSKSVAPAEPSLRDSLAAMRELAQTNETPSVGGS
ncbi:MAG: chromosome segregation protein SMC [Phycisphaerae bacterium]|nr:chromosome segregation protein SMC [Phycisphaerae bacterium]